MDLTKSSTPVTKTWSNFTILSYRVRDVDTSALPVFTAKALFVAGKGRAGLTKAWPRKCEGSRNFSIVWFLQPVFATVWSGLSRDLGLEVLYEQKYAPIAFFL